MLVLFQLQNLNQKTIKTSHMAEFVDVPSGCPDLFFVASGNKQTFCNDANFSGLQNNYCNLENESVAELIHCKYVASV